MTGHGPRWLLTAAPVAALVVAVPLVAAGLMASRPDVAVLGVPLVVAAAIGIDRRRAGGEAGDAASGTDAAGAPAASALVEPSRNGTELPYRIRIPSPPGTDAVHVRLTLLGGVTRDLVVSPRTAAELTGAVLLLHSGPQEFVRATFRPLGPDGSRLGEVAGPVVATGVISPSFTAIRSLPLPPRLSGLTGGHDSARPGDGGDFRDVHPFAPGDRLRRIDWKATARRGRFAGELYVRRTTATADATVVIVVDSRDDVGEQVVQWSRNSAAEKGVGSLDVAREAASSIAAGYIRAGDRVGFEDLASRGRLVAPGGGTRHLQRLLNAIELSRPSAAPTRRNRPPVIAPGGLVFVLSTFLDEEAPRMAELWRSAGHRVIAVDVLPPSRLEGTSPHERVAHRIVMMERDDRMRDLAAQGVDLLRWPEDDPAVPREARLQALARPERRR